MLLNLLSFASFIYGSYVVLTSESIYDNGFEDALSFALLGFAGGTMSGILNLIVALVAGIKAQAPVTETYAQRFEKMSSFFTRMTGITLLLGLLACFLPFIFATFRHYL